MHSDMPEDTPLAPGRWHTLRNALIGATAAVVVTSVGVLGAWSWYIARHRELHIINGFAVPVQVALDDREPLEIRPGQRIPVAVAEGSHVAVVKIDGQLFSEKSFEIGTDPLSRFYKHPAFVFNAGGGAAVMWEEAVYGRPVTPGGMRLYVGQYIMFDDVSCPFTQFPESLQTQGLKVRKTRLEILPISADQVLSAPLNVVGISDRLGFAEAHLRLTPNDQPLLEAYRAVSQEHGQAERAKLFLADRRSVKSAE